MSDRQKWSIFRISSLKLGLTHNLRVKTRVNVIFYEQLIFDIHFNKMRVFFFSLRKYIAFKDKKSIPKFIAFI